MKYFKLLNTENYVKYKGMEMLEQRLNITNMQRIFINYNCLCIGHKLRKFQWSESTTPEKTLWRI